MGRLDGKVAIVTGGGEGIGRAICDLFAEEGASLGIIDYNAELGNGSAKEIAALTGAKTIAAAADVSDEGQVETAVKAIVDAVGAPTILVNNAATFVFKGIEATPEEWWQSLAVNVIGVALVTRAVVPYMQEAGKGSIINMGSVSGFIAQKGFLTYNASKGAVVQMTRCLALDLVEDGIRVNGVCPGVAWSAAVQRFVGEMGWTREVAHQQPNLGLETMMKRAADPREIAYAALFLASDESSYVTGENLMVDGGWMAQ